MWWMTRYQRMNAGTATEKFDLQSTRVYPIEASCLTSQPIRRKVVWNLLLSNFVAEGTLTPLNRLKNNRAVLLYITCIVNKFVRRARGAQHPWPNPKRQGR